MLSGYLDVGSIRAEEQDAPPAFAIGGDLSSQYLDLYFHVEIARFASTLNPTLFNS